MIIDYINFTPLSSLIGGMTIGLASVLMLLIFGRIAGISGILGSGLRMPKNDTAWRFVFLLGIIFSGIIFSSFINFEKINLENVSYFSLVLAGLLVGFGTRLGSGCTSGHGICGISRFSKRSIIATITFLLSGIVTVFILNL